MKLKNFFSGLMLLSSLSAFAAGGSGIGGGMNFALINWCDDASMMVRETREEALERLNYSSDRIGSLRVFYEGLIAAGATSEDTEVTAKNSLTYRAITRGIRMSQLLGVPAIINGGRTETGLSGELNIQGLLSFMDWYTIHIQDVANKVDRAHFIPYTTRHHLSTLDLEKQLLDISLSQLVGLKSKFVRLKSDQSSYYATIPATQFMRSLSYLSGEVATDLSETVFANSLECQSKRLNRLSRQIQTYLDGRAGSSDDAIKLNRYVLEMNTIMRQIEHKNCSY